MADFSLSPADFNATTVLVTAVSASARSFLAVHVSPGAVGVTLPKSAFQGFADSANAAGLTLL